MKIKAIYRLYRLKLMQYRSYRAFLKWRRCRMRYYDGDFGRVNYIVNDDIKQ